MVYKGVGYPVIIPSHFIFYRSVKQIDHEHGY